MIISKESRNLLFLKNNNSHVYKEKSLINYNFIINKNLCRKGKESVGSIDRLPGELCDVNIGHILLMTKRLEN